MKNTFLFKGFLFTLFLCLSMIGCAEREVVYAPMAPEETGIFEYCDDYGCRWIDAPHYYRDGELIYWDEHFGIWVGPSGYWYGGMRFEGVYPNYRAWYHHGWYHAHPGPSVYHYHSAPRGHYRR